MGLGTLGDGLCDVVVGEPHRDGSIVFPFPQDVVDAGRVKIYSTASTPMTREYISKNFWSRLKFLLRSLLLCCAGGDYIPNPHRQKRGGLSDNTKLWTSNIIFIILGAL